MKRIISAVLAALAALTGCSAVQRNDVPPGTGTYTQISQSEAQEMMQRGDGHIIVDVRRQDEYESGHIPGAVLIPNESISDTPPAELPDPAQVILIYCRTGNRSKQAAQKLADMGYSNIYEFGGITTWQGSIVSGSEQTEGNGMNYELVFHSFDGGGPRFSAAAADPEIVSASLRTVRKTDPKSTETGSPFSVICTLTGLRPGKTNVTVEERSPIADNSDHIYTVTVGEDLGITVAERGAFESQGVLAEMKMLINDREVPAKWLWNPSVLELSYALPITMKLHKHGEYAQAGMIFEYGDSIPSEDEHITALPGDIMLDGGNRLVIFSGPETGDYTRLGIIDLPEDELRELPGSGDITVTLCK